MAEVMASAATGVLGSVIGKLTAMLGEKHQLARDAKQGICFLKEELSTMDVVLQNLASKDDDQIDPLAKDWRSKVRELSLDIEDCIDRFRLNHSHGGSKANFVRKAVRKVKILLQDRGLAEEIQKLKSLVMEQSERAKRYDIHKCLGASPPPVPLDPRASALFQEATDLVGIDGPCKEIIELLKSEALIPGQDRESMEEVATSYLNDLINRSLVQPVKVGADGATVKTCRVHDVILEFIVSKAVEDNFVTIWNRNGFSDNYSSNKIRRLSIQEDISGQAEEMMKTLKNAAHIRSISIFGDNNSVLGKHASEFLSSQVLRVLNIRGGGVGEFYLGHVKRISQMKYCRITDGTQDLPEDIEKLQHLETLDIFDTGIRKLPASIIQLQRLVRLRVDPEVQLPDGIGNLQALEELSTIDLGFQSVKFIQGLGDLINLKVLEIFWQCDTVGRDVEGHKKACISSLTKLFTRLRQLSVVGWLDATFPFMSLCGGTPPPLQRLVLSIWNKSSAVPHQISSLLNLTRLYIGLSGEVSKEGINILASLPILLSLTVFLDDKEGDSGVFHPRHAINSQGFQRLVKFTFRCWSEAVLEFEPGAMPKLQMLKLDLRARCQFKYGDGGLVLGLQNLAGLKHVALSIKCEAATADEVDSLEDDIRGAAGLHHNRPIVQVERWCLRFDGTRVQQATIRTS
ncbi:disease resistance protein Pik-2-like [Panicum virgatum]|uniref:disease resistance protein Pik-2-like n=1 Tax=Panicum virgatum TaxID=38727 RepID=UPI0019D5482E|nr:disease resistance protein Pik-2-like [Panicum virgatum]